MKNKIVLITGATSGIGFQTALALVGMGARVVITGRNAKSGEEAAASIRSASSNPNVDLLTGDLSQQKNIHALVGQFTTQHQHLDVLINNAGLAASKRELTPDGIEAGFAVNVIAPFLLTRLLLDSLTAAPNPRVITLMGGDVPAKLELDNLQAERSFDGLNTYSQSKLAMMTLMYEFAQREKRVKSNICYPGQASTNMTRSVSPEMLPGFLRLIFPLFQFMVRDDGGRSAAKAARSSIFLASSSKAAGVTGMYFDSNSQQAAWPPPVLDPTNRAHLWNLAEGLIQK